MSRSDDKQIPTKTAKRKKAAKKETEMTTKAEKASTHEVDLAAIAEGLKNLSTMPETLVKMQESMANMGGVLTLLLHAAQEMRAAQAGVAADSIPPSQPQPQPEPQQAATPPPTTTTNTVVKTTTGRRPLSNYSMHKRFIDRHMEDKEIAIERQLLRFEQEKAELRLKAEMAAIRPSAMAIATERARTLMADIEVLRSRDSLTVAELIQVQQSEKELLYLTQTHSGWMEGQDAAKLTRSIGGALLGGVTGVAAGIGLFGGAAAALAAPPIGLLALIGMGGGMAFVNRPKDVI